jgi:DNA-binding winged helix-turn-helix (wHTH) protein
LTPSPRLDVKVQFADCVLDVDARTVCRETAAIHLSPKAFELLAALVEHRGRAMSKTELLERVWPGVFVSDASLARVVKEIRKALGDSPHDSRIIRTVHRYGYAFAAVVVRGSPSGLPVADRERPACWLTGRARTFSLAEGEHLVGREPGVTVWLDSPRVSRRDARILVGNARAMIEDLDSKNGTFVRDVRLTAPALLEAGDAIRIGPLTLIFRVSNALPLTETESGRTRHLRIRA